MQSDLGKSESHQLKNFYETMSTQIKQIYNKEGDTTDENMKQVILLGMIKAQQQQLLVSSAMEHLNCPVTLKLVPRTTACRDLIKSRQVNPNVQISTKLITKLQQVYQAL